MASQKEEKVRKLWTQLMRYQTDFSMPFELSFYYGCADWINARKVIDLGTGNGYYLSKLIECFPSKEFTGIDIDASYIDLARDKFYNCPEYQNCKIDLAVKDVYEVDEKYDFVLARLLVQHLKSIDDFLNHIYSILQPGGVLLVVESNDEVRQFSPELPYVKNFFHTLRNARKKAGCDRDAGTIICSKAQESGFQPVKETQLLIPSTIPSYKTLLFNSYNTAFEVVENDFEMDFDYKTLKTELRDWLNIPNSYTQIGVNIACYKRR